jgi:MotA/MotB-like proton-channel complex protein
MAANPKGSSGESAPRPIYIKRIKKVAGGHHGGAWKVAYADFVTAMMAFFLLMWLLNATTEEQRKGLADYFSPSNLMAHTHGDSVLELLHISRQKFDRLIRSGACILVADEICWRWSWRAWHAWCANSSGIL